MLLINIDPRILNKILANWILQFPIFQVNSLPSAAAAAKSLQSCLTLRPHRWQPTRLPCSWDSPGKNSGVGCHFLLQCIKAKSESEVAQVCPIPSDPRDCSLPSSSAHGIFQARVLEWGAIAFSDISSQRFLLVWWSFCLSQGTIINMKDFGAF